MSSAADVPRLCDIFHGMPSSDAGRCAPRKRGRDTARRSWALRGARYYPCRAGLPSRINDTPSAVVRSGRFRAVARSPEQIFYEAGAFVNRDATIVGFDALIGTTHEDTAPGLCRSGTISCSRAHSIGHELGIRDYKRAEALDLHDRDQELLPFCAF